MALLRVLSLFYALGAGQLPAFWFIRLGLFFASRTRVATRRGSIFSPWPTTPKARQIEVLWDAEIGTRVIADDTWSTIGRSAPAGSARRLFARDPLANRTAASHPR